MDAGCRVSHQRDGAAGLAPGGSRAAVHAALGRVVPPSLILSFIQTRTPRTPWCVRGAWFRGSWDGSAGLPPGDFTAKPALRAFGFPRAPHEPHPRARGRADGVDTSQIGPGPARRVGAVHRPVHDCEAGRSPIPDLDE